MSDIDLNLSNLSSADLTLASKLCERIHYIRDDESFSNHATVVLSNALEHNHFTVLHFKAKPLKILTAHSTSIAPDVFSAFKSHIHQHPLLPLFAEGSKPMVSTLQSTTPMTQFRDTDLYNEIFLPLDIEDQLLLNLHHKEDLYTIAFDRDTPFSQTEQSLMQVVLPHVHKAWENWHRIGGLKQKIHLLTGSGGDVEQAHAVNQLMDRLTRRQKEVVELVAQGLENRKIAEALHISPKTVSKHLENIFETLDIHHRAALASKWQQAKKRID